jgi:hypothetical protein
MIFEAVITTKDLDGGVHITPMGYRVEAGEVIIAPFAPSQTLDNLRREGVAVLNFTDDVLIVAGCLTGRRDWPVIPIEGFDAWRLRDTLTHQVLSVTRVEDDKTRPRFFCDVEQEVIHGPYKGFNRAQAAVIEAAILVSRLDWLAPEKLDTEMRYLKNAMDKTAGPRERQAWEWLRAAVNAHPKHRLPDRGRE